MNQEEQIRFKCPKCGRGMRLSAKYAGKRGTCKCGEVIKIPLQSTCKSCGKALREVQKSGVPTGKYVCTTCFGSPGVEPYIEVLLDKKVLRFDTLEKIQDELLSGDITRHHQSRWIEQKPILTNYDGDKGKHDEAVEGWKIRRQWRAIGDGIALEHNKIQVLYHPIKVCAWLGFYIVSVISFIFHFVVMLILMVPDFREELKKIGTEPFRGIPFIIISIIAMTVMVFIFSCIIGLILGYPIGALIGALIGKIFKASFPKPPDDGWDK